MAGAAPFGEDLTVVVVGGGERQPVSNPLESVQRTAAVLRTPDGLQCSAVVGVSSRVVTLRPSGGFTPPGVVRKQASTDASLAFAVGFGLISLLPDQGF